MFLYVEVYQWIRAIYDPNKHFNPYVTLRHSREVDMNSYN